MKATKAPESTSAFKLTVVVPSEKGFVGGIIEPLRKAGHEVTVNKVVEGTQAIILFSVSAVELGAKLQAENPTIPFFTYNWDLYPDFVKQGTYKWDLFADVMRKSKENWVPSKEVALRADELYGIKNNIVVYTYAQIFDHPKVRDDRFVLNAMREYPWDRQFTWFRSACDELDIPYAQSEHKLTWDEYKDRLASCSFVVCAYEEASTGGLALMEGHALGKPVLFCDGTYQGANDYFKDRDVNRFRVGDYEDFKLKLKQMWDNPTSHDREECKKWAERFDPSRMAWAITDRLLVNLL